MTYSVRTLTDVLDIQTPRDKLLPFHLGHYDILEKNDFDLKNLADFPDYRSYFEGVASQGLAYSFVIDEKIMGIFGVFELWPGVYEFWMIPARDLRAKTIRFHRKVIRFFDYFFAKTRPKRVQFTVHSLNFHADTWANRCYFKKEAVMEKYGPDGADYFMYARFK